MSQLESYIRRYGPSAGPKLYHAVRSRAAFMGVNRRRRAALTQLTGRPAGRLDSPTSREATGLLPFAPTDAVEATPVGAVASA